MTKKDITKRSAVIFPKNRKILEQLGENIKLAYKRRSYTQSQISERTGLSRLTIRKIEQGDPKVSIGHYVAVLSVLGLVEDFAQVANDDELGRKLQDIKLMASKKEPQKGKAR
ncbi:MAG: helix-turn-helix domain-containing protein [Endozoicomonas sp.]|uniref:helix-turn-helix domain-containing protein n=1 Tax=Endozoicomonas sp. TaxID=1892382 RepID=UPI003D9BC88E